METTIKATVYAKKLHARLAELRRDKKVAKGEHAAALVLWRREMTAWLKQFAPARIAKLSDGEIREHRGWSNREECPFNADKFFEGCPRPPKQCDFEALIRKVQGRIRYLAITAQDKVKVSEKETNELFGCSLEDDES